MQTLVVPFVFKAVSSQTKEEFKLYTLAKLKTVLMTAKGDGMLAVLKHVDDLSKLMSRFGNQRILRAVKCCSGPLCSISVLHCMSPLSWSTRDLGKVFWISPGILLESLSFHCSSEH